MALSTSRSRFHRLAPIPLLLVPALALGACQAQAPAPAAGESSATSGDAATGADPGAGTTVVVASRNEVTTLDPSQSSYLQVDAAVDPMYDTLVTFDGEGELVGALASEFSYNEDATELTITLRDDVVFHDGTPLTAVDVQYTLDRIQAIGSGIVGQMAGYAATEVVDDHTLVISLEAPDALFASKLSRVYILNSALVTEHEGSDNAQSWLLNNDAGSGPFTLAASESGTFTYSRFGDYYDFDPARPETVVLRRIDELSASRDELLAGSIDVSGIAAADLADVSAAGFTVTPVGSSMAMVWLNNTAGATADPAVREALRLAYDYSGGLSGIRSGNGTLNRSVLPAELACAADLPEVAQDLDAASAVLDAAGIDNLTLTLRYQPAFEEQVQEATLLQSNLSEIGVTLNLEPIAFADYLTMLTDWNEIPEMMLAGEGLPVPDPGVMLTQVYASDAVGTNKPAYSNPEADSLIDQVKSTPDATERCELMKQLEVLLDEDNASMPLYTNANNVALSAKLAAPTSPPSTPSGQLAIDHLRVAG